MKTRNYINNKDLYEALKKHREALQESILQNKIKPRVSNYIGESILLICNNLGKKINFAGYTYKQEMISDGIIDCIAAVDNFNPEKTNNPFAYFTQIAWNAFVRRIQKEHKQTYIKHKNFQNTVLHDMIEFSNTKELKNEYSDDIITNFEKRFTKAKKQAKITGIEKFVEGSNE